MLAIDAHLDLIPLDKYMRSVYKGWRFSMKIFNSILNTIKIMGHDNLSMFKNLLKYRHESKK